METSKENNRALSKLNIKLLEIMNDRDILASYLLSPLSKLTNPEHACHYKLVKGSQSNLVNDLFINNTISVTLYGSSLIFSDSNKKV